MLCSIKNDMIYLCIFIILLHKIVEKLISQVDCLNKHLLFLDLSVKYIGTVLFNEIKILLILPERIKMVAKLTIPHKNLFLRFSKFIYCYFQAEQRMLKYLTKYIKTQHKLFLNKAQRNIVIKHYKTIENYKNLNRFSYGFLITSNLKLLRSFLVCCFQQSFQLSIISRKTKILKSFDFKSFEIVDSL